MILAVDVQITRLGLAVVRESGTPTYLLTVPINLPGRTLGTQVREAVYEAIRVGDPRHALSMLCLEDVTYSPMSKRNLRDYGGVWHLTADAVLQLRPGVALEATDSNVWKQEVFGTNRVDKKGGQVTRWGQQYAEEHGWVGEPLAEDSADALAIAVANLLRRYPNERSTT